MTSTGSGVRSVARMARGTIRWRNKGVRILVLIAVAATWQANRTGAASRPARCRMPVPSISESHSQGLNLPDLTDSVELQRGGFWRRTFALFIDLAAIIAVLQMTAVVLFPLTNGHVQFSGGPLYALNCEYLESVPEGLSISAEFAANSITDCQQSLLGRPTSRTLSVSRITRDGAVTKVAQIRHMLDAEGKPARGLPLDILILPLLIALRFALDRIGASLFVGSLFGGSLVGGSLFGGSLGRRICRIRLRSQWVVYVRHSRGRLDLAEVSRTFF